MSAEGAAVLEMHVLAAGPDPHPGVAGPVPVGEQVVGHFHVRVRPFPEARAPSCRAAHPAAAALGPDQRVVTVGVQRGLHTSTAEGARLAQWQAEVPCEPHPVRPPDVVRLVRVVVPTSPMNPALHCAPDRSARNCCIIPNVHVYRSACPTRSLGTHHREQDRGV